MLTKVMGAAIFAVGFLMLLFGVFYLIGIGNLGYDLSRAILIFFGGILLTLIGYFMARRLPRVTTTPDEIVQTTTEIQQQPPAEHF